MTDRPGGDETVAWRALSWAVNRLAEATEPPPGSALELAPDSTPGPAPWSVSTPPAAWQADASQDHERYRAWLAARAAGAPGSAGGDGGPTFSVVVPAYRSDLSILERCVESVRAQSWSRWELCICDDGSGDPALSRYLRVQSSRDPRVKVTALAKNQGISAATNAAASLGNGELIALLDHDDELTPGALEAVADALARNPDADVAYTDEDKLDPRGMAFGPRFKPDFSPDYLLTTPYLGHLFVLRRSLFAQLGGMRSKMDGSQDYDLMLRATEAARAVLHVPELAYHWRVVPGSAAGDSTAKPWAYAASGRALTSALRRRGEDAELEPGPMPGMWNARRRLGDDVTVSVVVSAVGNAGHLRTCLDRLSSGSVEPLPGTSSVTVAEVAVATDERPDLETRALIAGLAERPEVGVFSGPNLIAAANAAGRSNRCDLVLFLDSRVRPGPGGWMSAMAEHTMREGVGPVGARLLSADGLVRHVGLVLGPAGRPAAPVLEGLAAEEYGYLESARVTRNWSAVSGACLMIRRDLLDQLGWLDESMGHWADVDLCLRAAQLGQRSLLCSIAELVSDLPPSGVGGGAEGDTSQFLGKWGDLVRRGDPFFSRHLSRLRPECVIADSEEEDRWNSLTWPPAR